MARHPGSSDPGAAGLLPGSVAQPSPPHEPAASLAPETLASVVNAAREYWAASGLTAGQLADLYNTPIGIADLSSRGALGMATPEGIWIDDDGAGWGWAVVSCQLSVGSGQWGDGWISTTDHGQLTTAGFSLLTVVTHELGHAIGLGHEDHGLMAPSLAAADHVVAGRRTAIGELTDSELAAGGRELLGGRALVAASGRQMQDDAVDQVLTDSLLNRYRIDAVDDEEDFAGIERASQRDAEHDQLDLLFAALGAPRQASN